MRPKTWKSLLLKVRHLDLEVEDHQDLLKEHQAEFERLVREAAGEPVVASNEPDEPGLIKADPEAPPGAAPPEAAPPPDYPDVIRKLWRAIAAKTHPDKTGGDPHLTDLYKEAVDALDRAAFERLIDIALELGIQIPMDEDLVPYIQQRADALTAEVRRIEELAVWAWMQAKTDAERAKIIANVATIYKRRKK